MQSVGFGSGFEDAKLNVVVVDTPAYTVNGDILVFASHSNAQPFNTLAGWTLLHDQVLSNTTQTLRVWYKSAFNEPVSYSWVKGGGTASGTCGIMFGIHGAQLPLDVQSLKSNTAVSASMPGINVDPAGSNQVMIWIGVRGSVTTGSFIAPPTGYGGALMIVNIGAALTSAQLAFAAAVYPSNAITTAAWSSGTIPSGSARSVVSMLTFPDAPDISNPLQFCEV